MKHNVPRILILWNFYETDTYLDLIEWNNWSFTSQAGWGWFVLFSHWAAREYCAINAQTYTIINSPLNFRTQSKTKILSHLSPALGNAMLQPLTAFIYSRNVCCFTSVTTLPTHAATLILTWEIPREISSAQVTAGASLKGTSFAGVSPTSPAHKVSQLFQGVHLTLAA